MGEWCYAFCFPGTDSVLRPAKALAPLRRGGFESDGSIVRVSITEDGHAFEDSSPIDLVPPYEDNLKSELVRGEQLMMEFTSPELNLTFYVATKAANPYCFLATSNKALGRSPETIRVYLRNVIAQTAEAIQAAYVLFFLEASEYVDESFIEVDGIRLYSGLLPDGRKEQLELIWISMQRGADLPQGVPLRSRGPVGWGFEAFEPADEG